MIQLTTKQDYEVVIEQEFKSIDFKSSPAYVCQQIDKFLETCQFRRNKKYHHWLNKLCIDLIEMQGNRHLINSISKILVETYRSLTPSDKQIVDDFLNKKWDHSDLRQRLPRINSELTLAILRDEKEQRYKINLRKHFVEHYINTSTNIDWNLVQELVKGKESIFHDIQIVLKKNYEGLKLLGVNLKKEPTEAKKELKKNYLENIEIYHLQFKNSLNFAEAIDFYELILKSDFESKYEYYYEWVLNYKWSYREYQKLRGIVSRIIDKVSEPELLTKTIPDYALTSKSWKGYSHALCARIERLKNDNS